VPDVPEEARDTASVGEGRSAAGTVDRARQGEDEVCFRAHGVFFHRGMLPLETVA